MGGEDSWPSAGLSPRPLCTDGALSRHRRHRLLLLTMLRAWAALGTPTTPPRDDGQQLFLNRMEPQPKGPGAEPGAGVSCRSRRLPLFSFRTFQLAFKATVLKAIWKMLQVRGKKIAILRQHLSGLRPAPPAWLPQAPTAASFSRGRPSAQHARLPAPWCAGPLAGQGRGC